MKKIIFFLACFCVVQVYAQNNNFKIDRNNLIWQKVYESQLDITALHNSLRLQPNYTEIKLDKDIISFEFQYEGKKDLSAFGFKKGRFPSFIWPGGSCSGFIEFKDGKYRVTINKIKLIDDYNGELIMNLSDYVVKKGKLRQQRRFTKITDLYNRFFADKFYVKQVVSSW